MFNLIPVILALLLAQPVSAQKSAGGSADNLRSRTSSPLNFNTQTYIHSWQSFPTITGRMLGNDRILRFEPERGFAQVVIFLASWCLPCQQLMPEFKKLEKDFSPKFTRFVYIFAHDTLADAEGFKKHHQIGDNAILGTPQILKDFRQPELPSVYISDRHKWLVMRKLDTKWEDLKEVERFLHLHTAF